MALEKGYLLVNNSIVDTNYTIKEHDLITHKVHRHEPPVSDKEIRIIATTPNIVVVDKPASMPVHPCGRYRHNSTIYILEREKNIKDLYIVHRLDRLTSGLLLFARSPEVSREIAVKMKKKEVEKVYLAKVLGNFPEEITVEQPISYIKRGKSHKQNAVDPSGKYALTSFKREFFDGTHSVVRCFPKTGRTHQIRLHLAWIGFPIINDPLYNDECAFKDDYLYDDIDPEASISANKEEAETPFPHCQDCKRIYKDPTQEEMQLYLHALSYKIEDMEFSTDYPEWAVDESPKST